MDLKNESSVCALCGKMKLEGDSLSQVGARFGRNVDNQGALGKLIECALKLDLNVLVNELNKKQETGEKVFIHSSCRTKLRNQSKSIKRSQASMETPIERKRSTRSEQILFNFKEQCFYCGNMCTLDSRHPERNNFIEVRTKSSKIYHATLELCNERNDFLSKTVEARLLNINDLVAVEARYHIYCRAKFEKPITTSSCGRPTSTEKLTVFNAACIKLEEDIDLYTVSEFYEMMQTLGEEIYSLKMTQNKLKEKYGDSMQLVSRQGKSNVIILDRFRHILCENWYTRKKHNAEDEKIRVITAAAKLLSDCIKNFDHDVKTYPLIEDVTNNENTCIPLLLKVFIRELIPVPLKQTSISQALFSAVRPQSIMPMQLGVAVTVDNVLSSKWLNVLLAKLGFASSYDEVIRYKQNIVKHDKINDILCPEGTTSIKFVGDNTDHDLATIDGKNTHHGLGSISIANGNFIENSNKKRLPRDKKDYWSNINCDNQITISQFYSSDVPVLSQIKFQEFTKVTLKPNLVDILWNMSHIFELQCPSWAAYMSRQVNNVLPISKVSMLPVINLPATDFNALYSLLSFVVIQSEKLKLGMPCVTFDQQLYVKAYEIAASKKMKVFIRIGGFHQLMSFLGAIGTLMERSGLKTALETVYASASVNHMFSGKAISRSLRGHMFAASSILSILLEEVWVELSDEEKTKIKLMYSSNMHNKNGDTDLEK
ncbi:uncharacterized protein LOC136091193 [Hydra vulgaris]|uniref:Uncharacterized protein LOC136091193 n=1 Tax=Hydra vulgaris TaxID=6087 RepID=A0ABM4DII1_HYDVU